MGEVAVTLQVMPEDQDTDLERITEEVKSKIDPRSIEEDPVAFGLISLKVVKIVPDDSGGSDKLQDTLMEIKGVKTVRVTDQRKLM